MTTRKYIPEIGKRVKLAAIYDYAQHVPQLPYWSWLTVRQIDGNQVKVEHYNAKDTGEFFTVPLAAIEKPVGWEERYTITVSPDKVDTVLSWFKRGIVCRQSHNLNVHYMPMVFQPMDNSGQPNWEFPEVTDRIPPEECERVFRVVKLEQEEINFVPQPDCQWCQGSGRRHISSVAKALQITVEEMRQRVADSTDSFFEHYDADSGLFDCNCRWGGFRTLDKKKREALKKQWAQQGWKAEYIPQGGGIWIRSRETVVHDWAA